MSISDQPCEDFESAVRAVLGYLHARFGFDLWMVTRTEGEDWIVLHVEDHGYGVRPGTVFRWSDSFCSRMVQGLGPRVAPDAAGVPAYAEAPIGRQVRIGAYIGLPLRRADGSLFGTLCAIDPRPQDESLRAEQPLLELLALLLGTVLQKDLAATEAARRAERLQAEALTDAMTALYNRRAWTRFLEHEEGRCRRYGAAACVIVVDLDGLKRINDGSGHAAGDELICRAAGALRKAARTVDVVARLGGDEFGVLCAECDGPHGRRLAGRLRTALREAGVDASIGIACRRPDAGIQAAWEQADQQMYEEKKTRTRGERDQPAGGRFAS